MASTFPSLPARRPRTISTSAWVSSFRSFLSPTSGSACKGHSRWTLSRYFLRAAHVCESTSVLNTRNARIEGVCEEFGRDRFAADAPGSVAACVSTNAPVTFTSRPTRELRSSALSSFTWHCVVSEENTCRSRPALNTPSSSAHLPAPRHDATWTIRTEQSGCLAVQSGRRN